MVADLIVIGQSRPHAAVVLQRRRTGPDHHTRRAAALRRGRPPPTAPWCLPDRSVTRCDSTLNPPLTTRDLMCPERVLSREGIRCRPIRPPSPGQGAGSAARQRDDGPRWVIRPVHLRAERGNQIPGGVATPGKGAANGRSQPVGAGRSRSSVLPQACGWPPRERCCASFHSWWRVGRREWVLDRSVWSAVPFAYPLTRYTPASLAPPSEVGRPW